MLGWLLLAQPWSTGQLCNSPLALAGTLDPSWLFPPSDGLVQNLPSALMPPELYSKWQLQPGVDTNPKSKRPCACFPAIKAGGIHSSLGTAEGELARAHPQSLCRKMESGPWPGGRTVGHSIKWVVGILGASLSPAGHIGGQDKKVWAREWTSYKSIRCIKWCKYKSISYNTL